MQIDNYVEFLAERNGRFIDSISSDSGLYLARPMRDLLATKRQLVMLSFDPPLGSPPFAFGWDEAQVHFFASPQHEEACYAQVAEALSNSEMGVVVILEHADTPERGNIQRWMREFREFLPQGTAAPVFLLAEYHGPLMPLTYESIEEEGQ